MRVSILLACFLSAVAASGCRDASSAGSHPVESRRSGLAERESFRPPSDGLLTAPQVEAFLRVRDATVRFAARPGQDAPLEGEEGLSGAVEARAAEIRAARALSVPVEEYLWVRERVLEAEVATLTAKLNADVLALLGKTLETLRSRLETAPDEDSRRLLEEQIASFEAEATRVRREAAEKEPEAVRANQEVLAPFRRRLSTIADELSHLGAAAGPGPAGTQTTPGGRR